MALLSWVPPSKAQNGRFFKVALFAQKMQADPNFLHHLEGPRGCFQNLKKKIRNFFQNFGFWARKRENVTSLQVKKRAGPDPSESPHRGSSESP